MTLLLVSTNRELTPSPALPLGLMRVAEACEGAGIPVEFLDLAFARNPVAAIRNALVTHQPKMVGLSVRNIDNCDARRPIYYLGQVRPYVDAIREHADIPVVVGGASIALAPLAVRDVLGVNTVVAGPGEEALPALWAAHEAGEDLPELVHGEAANLAPTASFSRWLDLPRYKRRGAPINVQSRTGCPYGCVYCNYARMEGSRYELGDIDAVVESVRREVLATGIRSVEFVDSTFNSPPQYALQLCEALAKADLNLTLGASGITPRHGGLELLTAMKAAGFDTMWCSPDTAAPATIAGYGKGFTQDELAEMATNCHELGITCLWSFLFGGPEESEDTVRETIRFIEEAIPDSQRVLMGARMRIYPGTQLATRAVAEGFPEPVLDPHAPGQFYVSPLIDEASLDASLLACQTRNVNAMYVDDAQGVMVPWVQRMNALFGRRQPVWVDVPRFRKTLRVFGVHRLP